MDSKDKQTLKRIFSQIQLYNENLQSILEKIHKETQVKEDDDYDPLPDYLENACNHLYQCYCSLEEAVNS